MDVTGDRSRGSRPRGLAVVELVRLAVVLGLTAAGYAIAIDVAGVFVDEPDTDLTLLVGAVLGALVGYVLGGIVGRGFVTGVDVAEERLRRVEAAVLVSSVLGAVFGALVGLVVLWPVLFLPYELVLVPVAMVILAILAYVGGRLGAARGGDLLRYLGARGRLEVTSPARGGGVKIADTSALIDGRIVDIARAGFLDGTLVVPRFVLAEMQRLADTEEPRRRSAGRRGLDTLRALQEEHVISVEISDDDVPAVEDVDAKLAALSRQRRAALITVDANLARVAEIAGTRVLNLHSLAEALRPPVLPGERIIVTIAKTGREESQGVGYLPDGTMVVVERASEHVGEKVTAEVASLLQTRNGRMVFANVVDDPA